ncbi:MAG: MotA/TolQ/ExbB proton channel family protein [Steroidobacteraceae bacterium]
MIVENGMRATEHHDGRLTDQIPLNEWVTMSLQRSQEQLNSNLAKGLSFLATVGSTSPFVGLFGTVWGILNALTTIGTSGDASISKVAGPVGEALIMTAIGLMVAVPAVMGYNWLLGGNKKLMEQVRYFTADLHAMLIGGARVGGSTPAAAPRAK